MTHPRHRHAKTRGCMRVMRVMRRPSTQPATHPRHRHVTRDACTRSTRRHTHGAITTQPATHPRHRHVKREDACMSCDTPLRNPRRTRVRARQTRGRTLSTRRHTRDTIMSLLLWHQRMTHPRHRHVEREDARVLLAPRFEQHDTRARHVLLVHRPDVDRRDLRRRACACARARVPCRARDRRERCAVAACTWARQGYVIGGGGMFTGERWESRACTRRRASDPGGGGGVPARRAVPHAHHTRITRTSHAP